MNPENEQAKDAGRPPVPEVGPVYGHGWRCMWTFFLELLAITVVSAVIAAPSGFWSHGESARALLSSFRLISFIYGVLVVAPVELGIAFVSLKIARGERPKIVDMFEAFRNYWNAVAAGILLHVIILVGLVLLIVPGVIFACKLAFVPYLVVERKMDALDAIRESWRMTRGHAGQVFLVYLVAIPVALAGLLALGVGLILSIMWIRLALASLYYAVSSPVMRTVEGEPA